jgi:uncharacterized protein (TIGR02611 family)
MTAESDRTGEVVASGSRSGVAGSRAPAFIRRSRPLHLVWQGGVFVIGLAVVVGGVILLPLPGPGWLIIFAGVAIWGTEFAWAQRALRWARQQAGAAAKAVRRRFRRDGAGRPPR